MAAILLGVVLISGVLVLAGLMWMADVGSGGTFVLFFLVIGIGSYFWLVQISKTEQAHLKKELGKQFPLANFVEASSDLEGGGSVSFYIGPQSTYCHGEFSNEHGRLQFTWVVPEECQQLAEVH